MFIKYNGTNVHAMGQVNATDMKMNQSPQEVKWLQPGWNEFPSEIWKQNEKNPQIQKWLKKGVIELLSETVSVRIRDKKTGKVKTVKKTLGSTDVEMTIKYFDEKKAIDIVKHTFNRDILQRWIDEERRHKVKRALDKQIKPLLNTEREETEEDDENEDEF